MFLKSILAGMFLPKYALADASAPVTYSGFVESFVMFDGRVIDTGNRGISHTEGQGVAMLLAAKNGDKKTFDLCWSFAQQMRRPDGLFSWKIENGSIPDANNATDGDIYIAWALLEGAKSFASDEYRQEAIRLIEKIRVLLLKDTLHGKVILPGIDGFIHPVDNAEIVTVNLSYWVFPALRMFASETKHTDWLAAIQTGKDLMGYARFGEHELPPDWLELTDPVRPAPGFPPRFGHDAIRTALFLWWDKDYSAPLVKRFAKYAHRTKGLLPGFVGLDDNIPAEYAGGVGYESIRSLVTGNASAEIAGQANYYESSLVLLAQLASQR